jgi:RNA 2',3'-cyclic 3'-phosphodiesterase
VVRRLFVALTPPPSAVDHLDAAVTALRDRESGLRWTRPATWHLTLAFFGDVAEERQARLEERLAKLASRHDVSELRFRGAGAFARPARASVLWVGVDAQLPPLRALANSCAAAGRRIGLDVDERAYRPHLTLARAKGREPLDVRALVDELAAYEGPSWTASAIHLVRSHLGPAPSYETLASWPLRGYQA